MIQKQYNEKDKLIMELASALNLDEFLCWFSNKLRKIRFFNV